MPSLSKKSVRARKKRKFDSDWRPWSDLTPLVLERIRDLLDSDLYDLRLRSVCTDWRASLPLPSNRPYKFPIHLPRFPNPPRFHHSYRYRDPLHPPVLNCSRVYQISPADDPSNGWLVRSLDATPSTFTLLSLFHPTRIKRHPRLKRSLDLLQFRVSEVSRCYRIDNVPYGAVRKLLFLPNFVDGFDFTLLVLKDREMYYWNHGDSDWIPVDDEHYDFKDLIFFNGLCYGTNYRGLLVRIDSSFGLTEVTPPINYLASCRNIYWVKIILVPFKSDLLLVSMLSRKDSILEKTERVLIYKRMSDGWSSIRDLGDDDTALLASNEDIATTICARDFDGCKPNSVYFYQSPFGIVNKYRDLGMKGICMEDFDVYDMDEDRVYDDAMKKRSARMIWPPPKWMRLPPPPKSKCRLRQLQRGTASSRMTI